MNRKEKIIFAVISVLLLFPVISIIFSLIVASNAVDMTLLIPVVNAFFDAIAIFFLSPIFMFVFIQVLSVIFAYGLFKFHDIIRFKRFDYAVYDNVEENLNFKEFIIRALLLGFFAYSIGVLIVELAERLGRIDFIIPDPSVQQTLHLLVASLFALPILSLILIPVWVLLDSGAICARKKGKPRRQKLPDIEGVYRLYQSFVNGYISISTIAALVFIIIGEIIVEPDLQFIPFMIIGIFATTAMAMIPLLFYDWRMKNLREKFVKKLTKKGIRIVNDVNEI
jgi:hypothetical protein